MRDFLIAVCGIDGSGKSTLAKNILNRFTEKNLKCCIKRLTTYDEFLDKFNKVKDLYNMTYAHDFPEEIFANILSINFVYKFICEINPILTGDGNIIIFDRYYYSHLANQSAFGVNIESIKKILQLCPKPDLTIYLDADIDLAISRINKRENIKNCENKTFLYKVRENFLKLATEEEFLVINANEPENKILNLVEERFLQLYEE